MLSGGSGGGGDSGQCLGDAAAVAVQASRIGPLLHGGVGAGGGGKTTTYCHKKLLPR